MSKRTFYALSLTWGLPLNIVGGIVALTLLAKGHRPRLFEGCLCFELGATKWGGLNLGLVILCQKGAPEALKTHELGHAVQNCLWGVLTPLVVHLPSAVRFHLRNQKAKQGEPLPPYDAVWYEAQATRLGQLYRKGA